MKKVFLSLILLVSVGLVVAQEVEKLPIDPEVRYGKLENGLTYYIRHNEQPKQRCEFHIAQAVGAILEEDNQNGLAHFLEHMAFNGTEHFPGKGIINYFESIEFQQWSLSNFDILHKFPQVDPKYYKQELKNFIAKYFPKGSYLTTKGKTGSLGYSCRYENDFVTTLVPWISWLDSNGIVHRQQHVETTLSKAMYVQNYMLYKFLNEQRRV